MKTAVIGTYHKDFKQAVEIAENKSRKGREYSVIACNEGWLVVNDKYLPSESPASLNLPPSEELGQKTRDCATEQVKPPNRQK